MIASSYSTRRAWQVMYLLAVVTLLDIGQVINC